MRKGIRTSQQLSGVVHPLTVEITVSFLRVVPGMAYLKSGTRTRPAPVSQMTSDSGLFLAPPPPPSIALVSDEASSDERKAGEPFEPRYTQLYLSSSMLLMTRSDAPGDGSSTLVMRVATATAWWDGTALARGARSSSASATPSTIM